MHRSKPARAFLLDDVHALVNRTRDDPLSLSLLPSLRTYARPRERVASIFFSKLVADIHFFREKTFYENPDKKSARGISHRHSILTRHKKEDRIENIPAHTRSNLRYSFSNAYMSDLDWDDEEFEPTAVVQTKEQWDDEEEEEEEVKVVAPPKKKPVAKKPEAKAYVDETLADPIAEKLRQQKLVEEADLKAAIELFGSEEDFKDFKLDEFQPKNAKDFEKLATASVKKHFYEHRNSPHYKLALKTFMKVALSEFSGPDVKEIESHVAAIRNEKIKKEKEMQQKSKKATSGSKKKFINTGGTKGDAGLDDYKYDYEDVDDQYDFM